MEQHFSFDAEYAILGYVLTNNKIMHHIHFLDESHFYSAPHGAIFKSMQELNDAGDPITPFTIVIDTDSHERFKEAGGLVRYLGGAIAQALPLTQPVEHAKHLVRLAQKRRFVHSCKVASELAADPSDDLSAEEHAASLQSELERIVKGYGTPDFLNDHDVIYEIIEDLKDMRPPCSTGLPKLDRAMSGGLFPGRSYGFAARKKVGKTVLASTISCNLNQQGVKHLFICGEMSPKEIHQRNLARLANVFPSVFRTEEGQNLEFQKRLSQIAHDSNRCILYHNAPGLQFNELKRIASAAVFRHDIKGIILDYWQLVGGKAKGQSTAEHLDEVAQWIADFGRKHGIWTMTMAQINQQGNTRGGEGIRLAFDQVYEIHGMQSENGEDGQEDLSIPARWVEMKETRYTEWINLGDLQTAGWIMEPKGPWFSEAYG